ncbi:rab-GTPase-TBC domain-containing protein [Mycena floridula]|nr:rab-GTPase-TBC domain-containing protein [Mycena floridula]
MPEDEVDPIAQQTATATVPLDSLFSPQAASFDSNHLRESVTDSDFNDVALDDDNTFSPVTLSSAKRFSSMHSLGDVNKRRSIQITPEVIEPSAHKRSASNTTIRSSKTLSFLAARLEKNGTENGAGGGNRGSVDGKLKLQEEFARIQSETATEAEEKPAEVVSGAIDWDFWGAVISDYQAFAAENPTKLAEAIATGIPGTLRGMMWQLMAASKDPELESQYLKLLKETSPHEKAITRDLGRTFPHHAFFTDGQGIGQENLFNVLKAYSLYDTQVGYCQGLPFVVAILLLNMPDEEAFSLLVRLMHVYDLRGHFLPEMPKLQLRLYQFDRLLEELLPVLHIHFLRQGVKSSMFCSQWFLTMFSYRFPLEIVFRIYDNCFASGIEAIFGFSVMLLHKNEDLLLDLKFDDILGFINTKLFDRYKVDPTAQGDDAKYKVDEFVADAVSLRITPFMLDSYAHEYDDILRQTNQHAIQMDELRTANRALTAQVKSLENTLAQLSTEHVELLNELVKDRLRSEEMESELVRYKLLYAEAMHESADAQSAQRRASQSSQLSVPAKKRGSNGSR